MSVAQAHEFFVQWHLTERCNLRCRHCYQGVGTAEEMSQGQALSVVDEVSDTIEEWSEDYGIKFSPSANISGGEPLLRKDLFVIMEELRRRGFGLYLLTNGTLVDSGKARRLADLGLRGVQVSIEGPEDVHEEIRGKGSFSSSMRGVENLLAAGLTVTLNATLSRLNAPRFMELVVLAEESGVQRLGFSRLVPSGRGRELMGQALDKWQLSSLYEAIFSLKPSSLGIVTGDPVAMQSTLPDSVDAGSVPVGGCAAGLSGLTLLPDGTVLPCRRLPVSLGNVLEDSVREIWATSETLGALRDRQKYRGKCAACPRWAACRGCRAIAYAQGGNLLAEDPGCFIGD
ncbi:MAG: radical SAM protein [Nitrospirota bacterium]|jgi:radical SAM protein with 4Fe4S-binding SPASM domain